MACTIDHLRADVRAEVLKDFTEARGVAHRIGESGIIRKIELDWARQEILFEWERDGRSEKLYFKLSAKEGPRNGAMREFFAVSEDSSAIRPSPKRTEEAPVPTTNSSAQGHSKIPGESAVECSCDPQLHRPVLVEPRNIHVTACLRCGTVTCSQMIGDDGRFHGNAWSAYVPVPMPQAMIQWLGLWPRVKVELGPIRWPMSSLLVRRNYLYYPADLHCETAEELARVEAQLAREQSPKSPAQRLRDSKSPKTSPPAGLPRDLSDFIDVWEGLHIRPNAEVAKLLYLAQLANRASDLGVEVLWQRIDAFDLMVRGLRSHEELWQSAGHAMARNSPVGDEGVADVIIKIFDQLSYSPSPHAPGRIASCQRFESLLVLVADLKLATPAMFTTLEALQHRLIRKDAYLVKYIDIVLRELNGESPVENPTIHESLG